ncbi:sperm-associated antigen 8 [Rattus norvegicus]|nr:sperm-associated antigen 8 [Rattus norvegicus]|eukprot:NP_001167026.1 sperm-associated antigen 8 [Rattus norvegicus]
METTDSTEGSLTRSFDIQPSSEGLESTSEPIPSSGSSPKPTVQTGAAPSSAVCRGVPSPYCVFTDPSSDSLYEATCPAPHPRGHGRFGFQPLYVSYIPRDPCNTADLSSNPDPATSYPCHSSVHSSVSGSGPCFGVSSEPSQGSGPTSGPVPVSGPSLVSGPASVSGPDSSSSGTALAPGPGLPPRPEPAEPVPGTKLRTYIPQGFKCIPIDLFPNWGQNIHWKPQHTWEPVQVREPGVRGPRKRPEVEYEKILCKAQPRGQCLLYNWQEERATNQLDQIPPLQDGSESYFFRHGHQGLLTLQPQLPMPSSTTQKDSYQLPRHTCYPLRGKREAMLEILLQHQICKEVQREQEPTRKLSETESVTHHDYRVELVGTGPPAPTKPHDYRQEQPETFWIQHAAQLRGVNSIRTLDTPFRKNYSFSTPASLSLGQPLPYELENSPHQMGVMSSLACQGGQGDRRKRTTPF